MRNVWMGLVAVAVGCVPPSQSAVLVAPAPPGEVYTCVMRQLASMGYRVTDTDRASGFVRAEKEDGNSWITGTFWTEITAMAVPSGEGTQLQVHVQRSKAQGSGRTSTGLILTDDAKRDAGMVEGCAAEGG